MLKSMAFIAVTAISLDANALIVQEIDSFETGSQTVSLPDGPVTSTVALIGTELAISRTLTLKNLTGPSSSSSEVFTSPGLLTFNNNALTQADLDISWTFVPFDVSVWDAVRLTFPTLDQGALDVTFIVEDINGEQVTADLALLAPSVFEVDADTLTLNPLFDPLQTVQISLDINSLNAASDLTLADISFLREEIPAPGPLGLLSASLLGLGFTRRLS